MSAAGGQEAPGVCPMEIRQKSSYESRRSARVPGRIPAWVNGEEILYKNAEKGLTGSMEKRSIKQASKQADDTGIGDLIPALCHGLGLTEKLYTEYKQARLLRIFMQ